MYRLLARKPVFLRVFGTDSRENRKFLVIMVSEHHLFVVENH